MPEAGLRFRALPAHGFDRARPWTAVTSSLLIMISSIRALWWFLRWRPDVVVGFGGYASVPVAFAAVLLRIPLVVHEQNSVAGMANRLLARFASVVALTYEASRDTFPALRRFEVTGNPVRDEVLGADRGRGRRLLAVPDDARILLVFGGSRGARHLNQALVARARDIISCTDVHVVLITGPREYDAVVASAAPLNASDRLHLYPYIDDMGDVLAAADLVVCRAGATSIAELTALGLPAVLVPYPYATDDHQTGNAVTMRDAGAAEVIADADLDTQRFGDLVVSLIGDAERRATMTAASRALGHVDAAEALERLVRDAAQRA